MNIPRYWRNREQALRLAGIEKVDQANGIGLAHMRSSKETIEQVKKLRALMQQQAEEDEKNLAEVREEIKAEL
jgi:hypothetical protein